MKMLLRFLIVFAAVEICGANGPFSILQEGEEFWLARPNGEKFFSLGVSVVNQGLSRAELSSTNPAYAAWQHYADSNRWAAATVGRLKSWGFTTAGGWSDFRALKNCAEPEIFFAPVLHVGSTAGAPWWDMWDAKIIERMDSIAREQMLPLRDDPRVIGYYTDNEMGWWNGTLFKMTLEHGATSGQRQRLIAMLRTEYKNDWAALLRDFEPGDGVDGWEGLEQEGILFLRPGGEGMKVERRFLEMVADRYYSLTKGIIRKYDSRALILGDRYQSFYYPEVARAAGRHVDVASSNFNASWNDGSFVRFYLETLRALTKKPILVSEIYMCAEENRSGNKNDRGVFPVVKTQKERARGFRNSMEALLKVPYVVGAEWFQYYDEPMHGRYDGENFNFGLVDIRDRPYESLVKTAASLKRQPVRARANATQGVPPAPRDPMANFKPNLALKHWDREHGFVPATSEAPLADLYVCWNREAVYLGLWALDPTEEAFYKDGRIPESDRAEWVVSVNGQNIRSRIGAGLDPVVDPVGLKFRNISGLNGYFRNIACLEIPAMLFGLNRFKSGDEIEFQSTFFSHGRSYRADWSGKFALRSKRELN